MEGAVTFMVGITLCTLLTSVACVARGLKLISNIHKPRCADKDNTGY